MKPRRLLASRRWTAPGLRCSHGRTDHVRGWRHGRRCRDRGLGAHPLARRARRARETMVIRLGRPQVRGIVHSDLFEVEVPLDADGHPWPDEEWLSLFREHAEYPADLEEPRLEHGRL